MRFKLKFYFLAITFIILSFSCKGQNTKGVELRLIDTNDTLEALRNFKTKQLGEFSYLIQPPNTILEFDEPLFKLFIGKIEDKSVQYWLSIGYDPINRGVWYMEGNEGLQDKLLKKENQSFIFEYPDLTTKITYKPNDNFVTVQYKNKDYKIEESSVKFKVFVKYKYYNILNIKHVYLSQFQDYSSAYSLDHKRSKENSLFKKLKVMDMFTQYFTSSNYDVEENVREGKDYNEDELLNSSIQSHILVYFDDNIVVNKYLKLTDTAREFSESHYVNSSYLNYDLALHKSVELGEVIDFDNKLLLDHIYSKINQQYYKGSNSEPSMYKIKNPTTFYIQPTGIVLIYPQFMSSNPGEIQLFLSYDEIKPYLKIDKYFKK